MGQVNVQRRNGHSTLAGGMKVSTRGRITRFTGLADPIHGFTARTGLLDDRLSGMPSTQTRDLVRSNVGKRQVRDIHIQ